MKSVLLYSFLLINVVVLFAQSDQDSDLILITNAEQFSHHEEEKMSGLFKLYQKHISEQLISDCIYEESCSHFSEGAIKSYGLVKGLLMTIDRLTRCSRAAYAETPRVRINEKGKIMDHWDAYKKTK